jgi:hypothetical protein
MLSEAELTQILTHMPEFNIRADTHTLHILTGVESHFGFSSSLKI